jgi:hypothetical protein
MTFFGVNLVNVKINWMFVEYNGVLVIGGNCKKSPIKIMLNFPNGKRFNFNFCNLKCIVANKVQPIIDFWPQTSFNACFELHYCQLYISFSK